MVVRALVSSRPEEATGRQALLLAAAAGRTGLVLSLLESGVALEGRDARGRTALHHAALGGQTMTALALLRRGSSPATPDDHGTSVVHAAMQAGHTMTALALLRAAGADDSLRLLTVAGSPLALPSPPSVV